MDDLPTSGMNLRMERGVVNRSTLYSLAKVTSPISPHDEAILANSEAALIKMPVSTLISTFKPERFSNLVFQGCLNPAIPNLIVSLPIRQLIQSIAFIRLLDPEKLIIEGSNKMKKGLSPPL